MGVGVSVPGLVGSSMRTHLSLGSAALFAVLALAGCKKDGPATTFCLGPDGTSQDCGIGCKVEENEKACEKWKEKTIEICDKAGKDACQEICEADENDYACEKAKSM